MNPEESRLQALKKASVAPGPYGEGYGITLRQHFAGLAMQGAIAALAGNWNVELIYTNAANSGREAKEQLAFESVEYADALLAELAKEMK